MRDRLAPLADVLTPNRFELGWLTGRSVATLADVRAAAALLTGASHCAALVTSPPLPAGDTGVLVVGPSGRRAFPRAQLRGRAERRWRRFLAMIAAGLTVGARWDIYSPVEASAGADHLNIIRAADRWTRAPAIACERVPTEE